MNPQVAVSSSLRLLEPKRTVESRAKRSSINPVRTQHPSETMVFHNEDGNPARANIKQALASKTLNSSPNDDEEGTPVFREGSVHQPCYGDDLIQPRFDEHIPNSRHDSIIRHSVHDGLHTTTPVGEENQFEGNVGTSI
ncbi:hypothetical protein Tco_0024785 [Tanacetum coccineum]